MKLHEVLLFQPLFISGIHPFDSLIKGKYWLQACQTPRLITAYNQLHLVPILCSTFTLIMLIPCVVYAVGMPRWQQFSIQEKQIQQHKCLTCGFVNYSHHRHQWNSRGDSSVKSGTKPHCQVMNDWNSVVKFPVCCAPWHCGKENATRTIIHRCRVPQKMNYALVPSRP